ncbi:MAG: KH domain-containing protein [Elainellaceae cyanobacterium]
MTDPTLSASQQPQTTEPDYAELVKFLVAPFLTAQDSLRLDCEVSPRTGRVLLRLAIEGEDKGKVFGRGGRNLQAIRSVVQASAQLADRVVHVEVYGHSPERSSSSGEPERRRSPSRPAPPRPRSQRG